MAEPSTPETSAQTARSGAPSPKSPPHIGNIAMADFQRDPLGFVTNMIATHGDIFTYNTGGWMATLINHPAYIKHVLQTNTKNYTKTGSPELMMLRPMLGAGLMTSDGPAWRMQRRMLEPSFHQQRIQAYLADMVAATRAMMDRWHCRATADPVDIPGEMSRLTLHIVARCLFGIDLGDDSTGFGAAVDVMNEFMAHFDPWDRKRMAQFRQALGTLGQMAQRITAERAVAEDPPGDLLSLLLTAVDETTGDPLTEGQIRDQIFTFLMAGHETTAKALTWTLYLLDRHPEVQARARTEAVAVLSDKTPTVAMVEALDECWMVIQEAMRLYPPVWTMTRVAIQDDVVGGYAVRAGSLVVMNPYTVHRHPAFWLNANVFDPERFRPERVQTLPPFAYMAFSGGSRMCIGRRFAAMEMRVILGMLLSRFRCALFPHHPVEPEALVTLRPKYGLPMTVHSIF